VTAVLPFLFECRSEFAVNESVYCTAKNRYGVAPLAHLSGGFGSPAVPLSCSPKGQTAIVILPAFNTECAELIVGSGQESSTHCSVSSSAPLRTREPLRG